MKMTQKAEENEEGQQQKKESSQKMRVKKVGFIFSKVVLYSNYVKYLCPSWRISCGLNA